MHERKQHTYSENIRTEQRNQTEFNIWELNTTNIEILAITSKKKTKKKTIKKRDICTNKHRLSRGFRVETESSSVVWAFLVDLH